MLEFFQITKKSSGLKVLGCQTLAEAFELNRECNKTAGMVATRVSPPYSVRFGKDHWCSQSAGIHMPHPIH